VGKRDRYIVSAESLIHIVPADKESKVTKNEIETKTKNIKVTVSMFIADKFIIGGKIWDEKT
jgi:hypothetical protein